MFVNHLEIQTTGCDAARKEPRRTVKNGRRPRAARGVSLAKLYHSTDRPADAHAVLASALKGFSPTPGISRAGASANASQRAREVRDSEYIQEDAPGWKEGAKRPTDLCNALIKDFDGASNAKHSAFTVALSHYSTWCRRNDLEPVETPREYTKWIAARGEETSPDDGTTDYLTKTAKAIIRETESTGCIILTDDGNGGITTHIEGLSSRKARESLCIAIAGHLR
jgi:hypothetical protein